MTVAKTSMGEREGLAMRPRRVEEKADPSFRKKQLRAGNESVTSEAGKGSCTLIIQSAKKHS